jgi:hypothetical protein
VCAGVLPTSEINFEWRSENKDANLTKSFFNHYGGTDKQSLRAPLIAN